MLPEDNKKILGPSHPFLDEVTRDLIELCHHRNAGDFVICGWRISGRPFSFPAESGSHARPGPEETKAFALLPADMPLAYRHGNYLRPIDLRRSAFQLLGRSKIKISTQPDRQSGAGQTLRIMPGAGLESNFFLAKRSLLGNVDAWPDYYESNIRASITRSLAGKTIEKRSHSFRISGE